MDAEECMRRIEKCFPQLQICSIKPNEEGWDSFVFEVNDCFIFRFPRRPDQEVYLKREILLLPQLAKILSVRVPKFEFVCQGNAECAPFVGYRKIEGVPLTSDLIKSIQSDHLAQHLSKVLTELHRFPLQEALQSKVPYVSPIEWRQEYRNLYARVRDQVFPLLNVALRAKAIALWKSFLNEESYFQFKPVLLHRDLSGGHILCEPNGERIAGIIDWGDLSIGDPALDLTGLWHVYGSKFGERVLIGYEGKVEETFRERISFYSRLIPFHKILYGLNMHDSGRLELGLQQLCAELQGA